MRNAIYLAMILLLLAGPAAAMEGTDPATSTDTFDGTEYVMEAAGKEAWAQGVHGRAIDLWQQAKAAKDYVPQTCLKDLEEQLNALQKQLGQAVTNMAEANRMKDWSRLALEADKVRQLEEKVSQLEAELHTCFALADGIETTNLDEPLVAPDPLSLAETEADPTIV